MADRQLRTRIAPTPSGYLHWGNAFSFVITWLVARQNQGSLLLRIDDLDAQRKRPEYVEDIFRSLQWLGIDYDEGPSGPDDFESHFSQHSRLELYRAALDQLRNVGDLFACACTRRDLLQTGGIHAGSCRERKLDLDDDGTTWRMSTPSETIVRWPELLLPAQQFDIYSSNMRDFVVRRKDQIPAYQLTSVVDDMYFRTTCIVRGEDLVPSTAAQLLVARKMREPEFSTIRFLHHRLIKDEQGNKLSKSAGATSIQAMRAEHSTPAAFYRRVSALLGLPEPAAGIDDLLLQAKFQLA